MIVCRARQSCLRSAAKREGVNFVDNVSSSDEDGVNSEEYQLTRLGEHTIRRVYRRKLGEKLMTVIVTETNGAWRARAHRTAIGFEWDYGTEKLLEVIRRRCDLGTAMLIYWHGQPDFYRRHKRRSDLTIGRDEFDMLCEIERNVIDGFYTDRNIPFNPFDYMGRNWCANPIRDVYCELPEPMYRGVGTEEEMAQRQPIRSGIAGLPIGLSALADADPKPVTDLDKVIAYLNSLTGYGQIVEKTNGIVTGVSFCTNRKVVDDDLLNLKSFPDLVNLDLGPEMTDRAMEHLRFVPKLLTLSLSCGRITDDGLVNLQHVPGLAKLNMHGCRKITDAGLFHVGKLKQLRHLDIAATKIGDAGLAHLCGLSNLEHLDLYHYTKITNAGLVHLADLKTLKYLRLSFTKIGDRGLVHLYGLSNLKELVLGRTKVTEAGIALLKVALPECNIIQAEY